MEGQKTDKKSNIIGSYILLFKKKYLSNEQNIIANISWLFFEHILRMFIGLFVGVWIARHLGPADYGLLNYAIAFTSIFSIVSKLGLDGIIMRELSSNQKEKDEILGTAFALKLAGSFSTSIICIIFALAFANGQSKSIIMVTIITFSIIFQVYDIFEFWFRSKVRSKITVIAKNIVYIVMATLRVLFLIAGADVLVFTILIALEALLLLLSLSIAYYYDGNRFSLWTFNFLKAKQMLNDAWPLILSGVVIVVYMRIDQIMINSMIGSFELGKYSAAVKLSEYWSFIPVIIMHSFFSHLTKAATSNESKKVSSLQKLFNLMVFLGYLIALPISLLSSQIIKILYGAEYAGAGIVLSIYVWSGVFTNLTIARNAYLTIINRTKIHFFTSALGAIINIGANLILIPKYGGTGAAFATLISYSIHAYFICFVFAELRYMGVMMTKSIIYPFIILGTIIRKIATYVTTIIMGGK